MIRNLAAAYCVAFQNYKADIMSTVHSPEVVPASIARITEAVVVREVAALWPNLFGPNAGAQPSRAPRSVFSWDGM